MFHGLATALTARSYWMFSRETLMIVQPFAWFAKNRVPRESLNCIMEAAHQIKMMTLRKISNVTSWGVASVEVLSTVQPWVDWSSP